MAVKAKQIGMFGTHEVAYMPIPETPSAIICCVSGGIDSAATAIWTRRRWPNAPIILFHNHLEKMDWENTDDLIGVLAHRLGNCHRVSVQAVYELDGTTTPTGCNGTHLRRLHLVRDGETWHGPAQDDDPAALLTLLDFATRARLGQPPTAKIRYCTSYQKKTPTDRWLRENRKLIGENAIILSGERAAESITRSTKPETEPRFDSGDLSVVWHRPLLHLKWHQAVRMVVETGAECIHPGYFAQGETLAAMLDPNRDERGRARLSCVRCFMGAQRHLDAARVNAPQAIRRADEAMNRFEDTSGKTWRMPAKAKAVAVAA